MNIKQSRECIIKALHGIKVLDEAARDAFLAEPQKDVALVELGIDSVSVMDFCLLLENDMGREVEILELIDHPTLNTLAAHFAAA
jgi:acyl carrier protein